jgi:hypothetical protein
MTAPTPQQMRALADLSTSDYRLRMNEVRAALRAAADQLEAVRALERIYVDAWDSYAVPADALDAILTADTAPQEDRDA